MVIQIKINRYVISNDNFFREIKFNSIGWPCPEYSFIIFWNYTDLYIPGQIYYLVEVMKVMDRHIFLWYTTFTNTFLRTNFYVTWSENIWRRWSYNDNDDYSLFAIYSSTIEIYIFWSTLKFEIRRGRIKRVSYTQCWLAFFF